MIPKPDGWANAVFSSLVFLALAFLGGAFLIRWARGVDELDSKSYATARETLARGWMKQNEIEGHVSCLPGEALCDVVPRGDRAPFELRCSEHMKEFPGCKLGR